jgi:hypothetical protein
MYKVVVVVRLCARKTGGRQGGGLGQNLKPETEPLWLDLGRAM